MKHILLFIATIGFCAGSSDAQLNVWRWQNPLPEGDYLRAVQMVSLNTIYTCGDLTTFMRSTDGGMTWDIQSNIIKNNYEICTSLSFLDQNYGMCCTDSGRVLKTTDGGNSWQILTAKIQDKLSSIVVVDKNIALTISLGDGTLHGDGILRTLDGGITWNAVPMESLLSLYSIRMLRPDFLTITGYGGILLKSVDSGRTWQSIKTPFGNTNFSAIFFNGDEATATVIGDLGLIIRTTDGGAGWVQQQLADSTYITSSLNVVDGKDPNILAIVGDYGVLLFTTDGGTTWKQSFVGSYEFIKGLSFFDKLTATAVGRDGIILHTSDGGATWKFLPETPYTEILRSVAFPKGDTSLGIAVGNAGAILRTTNGGTAWEVIDSGSSPYRLYGVSFADSTTAIAVGEKGRIIKSTDAGLTWNPQPSGTHQDLYGVSFSTSQMGIAVGDSSTILQTYTAGAFWTPRFTSPPVFNDFFSCVSYPDSLHAYLSGFDILYKTTDGGISWHTIDKSSRASSISFADSLHGGFVYTDLYNIGYVCSTSDGGNTFNLLHPPGITNALWGIFFTDRWHATVVGNIGYIGHSTDGGASWNEQQSNTHNNLIAVSFGTVKAGTAVGWRGNIMRITTDEKPESAVRDHSASGSPKITLDPNYPNPFSQSTTISYNLPGSGFTTVEIFTIDGKRVAALINEFQISGEHSIRFDATDLSSGTYIIRVICGGMSVNGEMVIRH